LFEGDLGETWIDPVSAQLVGLDGDEKSLAVRPPREVLRSLPARGIHVTNLPPTLGIRMSSDVSHSDHLIVPINPI
jgi:hypothetical protein